MIKNGKYKMKPIAMTLWLCVLGSFALWLELHSRQEERERAMTTANAFFQKVMASIKWNANQEGVYVPLSDETQPNTARTILSHDLLTENGLRLTRIDPAYMTRQIAELVQENNQGIQFHITSLSPIRPENEATDWELKALKAFEKGQKEEGEFYKENNALWFRYMAPVAVGPECLKCHAQHGYQVGELRGGISVSIPLPSHKHQDLFAGYGLAAAIGLIFIFIGGNLYERKQCLFDATFNSPVPTSVTGLDHTILMANDAYWALFGPHSGYRKMLKCHEHRPGKMCHTKDCPLTRSIAGESSYTCECILKINGISRHFIVTSKSLRDNRDKLIGCVESFQEITDRKHMEEELHKTNRRLEALSIMDGLTEIANRRHFDEVLAQEYKRHVRTNAPLSLILLDLDYFKPFNDSYGHVEGDKCLQQVAQVLVDCANRPADLPARYGGEEFACILPETGHTDAVQVAEKIRRAVAALAIPHKGSKVADSVTASFGVVTVHCSTDGSPETLAAHADELLYRAKESGRNRVECLAPSEIVGEIMGNFVKLIWKDSYYCGNKLIDSQHQALFHRSNELLQAILSGRPPSEISAIITRLLGDVTQHFQDEEELLEAIGFPDRQQHAAKHAELLHKGLKLSEEFSAATLSIGDVFQFLAFDVVMRHMLETDRTFFPFITGQESPPPTHPG